MRRQRESALRRLAAIQNQQEGGANFAVAARAIDVALDDLIATFRDEMGKLGFVVAPTGRVQ